LAFGAPGGGFGASFGKTERDLRRAAARRERAPAGIAPCLAFN